MLEGCIRALHLDGLFDHVLSTDMARTYKPDLTRLPVSASTHSSCAGEEIAFAPFAGWDAAGAKSLELSDVLGEPARPSAQGALTSSPTLTRPI